MPNTIVKWLAVLMFILNVLDSNFGTDTGNRRMRLSR
jgi:hypothetical protein